MNKEKHSLIIIQKLNIILQRIELWTYPYQEYALPIKLKNFSTKSTQTWTENVKFGVSSFTIKLCSSSYSLLL